MFSLLKHKALVEPTNYDLVHHLLMFECDPAVTFDDDNLPDDLCDDLYTVLDKCTSNLATVWSVGGDHVRFFFINQEKKVEFE